MQKAILTLVAVATLTACNGYDPVSAATQDAHNEALKATYTPEGTLRP